MSLIRTAGFVFPGGACDAEGTYVPYIVQYSIGCALRMVDGHHVMHLMYAF